MALRQGALAEALVNHSAEIIAGRIHFYLAPPLALLPQYRDNELKILAVTSPERLRAVPEIPTLTEAGINFIRSGWLGVCAAEGTPQPIIDRLNREIAPIVAMPEYKALLENSGEIAVSLTPQELGQVINQTLDEAAASIVEFRLQPE